MTRRSFFAALAALPLMPGVIKKLGQTSELTETHHLIRVIEVPGSYSPEFEGMIQSVNAYDEAAAVNAKLDAIAQAMQVDKDILRYDFSE